jgi:hypothetical protein
VTDPGYAVPALVTLLYPGVRVVPVRPPLDPPRRVDCILRSAGLQIEAVPGANYNPGLYWDDVPTPPCPQAVAWDFASSHFGEVAMVRGPIVGVNPRPDLGLTALDIGEKGVFAVLIRRDAYRALPGLPTSGDAYVGSLICASGLVQQAAGAAVIFVESPLSFAIEGAPMVDLP